jgi:HK97 family phage portal protein
VIEIEITLQFNKHKLSFSTNKSSEASRINNPSYWPNDPRNTEFYSESRKNIEEQIKAYQGWVGDCVSLIAERIASIPLRLYDKNDELITDHPFYDLFRHVNPDVTGFMLKELISTYLDLTGECYIYIAENRLGMPGELFFLRPDWMTPIVKDGVIDHYKYRKDVKEAIYSKEDILFFRYPNPTDPYRGASPVQRKAYAYDTDLYNMIYQLNVFKNGAHLKGVLETETNLDPDQAKKYLNLFEETYGGAGKAHKTGILVGGMSYKNIGISNKDMEFMLLADWTMRQLASAYHTPPQKLSHPEHTNLANMKALDISWNRECILPRLTRIAEILNTFLIPFYKSEGIYCKFDNPVPEDQEFLLKKREINLKNFVISPNEARKEDGLDPSNWGKVPIGPMGVMPISSYSSEPELGKAKIADKNKTVKSKLTEEFKEAYWKEYIKRVTPLEDNFRREIIKLFQEQEIEALRELRKKKSIEIKDVDDVLKVPRSKEETKKFIKEILPRITEMVSLNGTSAYTELGVEGSFRVDNPKVIKWIKDKIGKLIKNEDGTGILDTTLKDLRKTLAEGVKEGESIPKLAKRVSSVYGEAKGYRSKLIARTETIAASNQGALQAYDQSGVVEKKEWLTALDERTCEECAALNGQIRKLQENFSGGVETPPLHPNCRCTIIPVLEKE